MIERKKTVFPQNMGATIIGTPKKSAWKRTCVYIDPTHREDDGLTGKRISKDHSWRIAEVSSVLGSESLQNYHQMPPTSPQVVWEGCQQINSAVNQQQTNICQMLLGLSMGSGYMVR